ncbi:branched-chain amino acid ABC transporter permease [Geomonas sp. RF6]|uniref:branched-chain amino acid ABC transporter permease n=1 Tax=Geomonas sp. RF6 TaxID=2897342 RepID=UPI001E58B88D|nr:branched-chain amino acid ABC transporter permease [Geomonas sp. RF6]UFS69294.1 branched-chain amino acid ABC transporter permease [Geomonas sp. RF6]
MGEPRKTHVTFRNVAVATLIVAALVQLLGNAGLFNNYYLHILAIIGMNIILVASLNLVNGYMGEFALGHAGFMAVGAYAAALIALKLPLPALARLPLSLAGGVLAAGLVGYLVGLVTFKTVGDYLAIITLGFNMIIVNAIQNIDYLGGPRGLTAIPKGTNLVTVAVCTVLTYWILRNLVDSIYGRMWLSIRENAIAGELMGIDVNRVKNLAFTIAAAFAGLAGGLYAQYQQFITPKSFDYLKTTDILVMLYLGGMGSLSGSILGVVFYTLLMELLRNILGIVAPQLADMRMLLSPLILVLIMLTRQYGLMGNREWRWLLPDEKKAEGSDA